MTTTRGAGARLGEREPIADQDAGGGRHAAPHHLAPDPSSFGRTDRSDVQTVSAWHGNVAPTDDPRRRELQSRAMTALFGLESVHWHVWSQRRRLAGHADAGARRSHAAHARADDAPSSTRPRASGRCTTCCELVPYQRVRPPVGVPGHFRESEVMARFAKEYGFSNVTIETFPQPARPGSRRVGELWMTTPQSREAVRHPRHRAVARRAQRRTAT